MGFCEGVKRVVREMFLVAGTVDVLSILAQAYEAQWSEDGTGLLAQK